MIEYLYKLFSPMCECGEKMEDILDSYELPNDGGSHWKCVNKNHDIDVRDRKLKKLIK